LFGFALTGAWATGFPAAAAQQVQAAPAGSLQVTVTDQNGLSLASAFVLLEQNGKVIYQERTTPSGSAVLHRLAPGTYKVLIEKQGFYSASVEKVEIAAGQTVPMEVRLDAVREYRSDVEVTAQPSPIDPETTASAQSVTSNEISMIPYPSTRDYRNVLPYIPGVIADFSGQIHVAGGSTQQVQDYLDGFEVGQPASGTLAVRVNPDSLRKVAVLSSRYSAMFGKGSAGLTDFEIQDGDNHFRVNATDFLPTFQNVKGIQFNNWTPRAYFSGPLVRNKAWFTLSHEGENDLNVVKELPDGADTNTVWRTSDLARLRVNLTPGNVLTASGLVNLLHSQNSGISAFDPVSVSTDNHSTLYVLTLKDQITLGGRTLLEFGAGYHRTNNSSFPQGFSPYVLTPTGRTGNFFQTTGSSSDRTQAFTNLYLQPLKFLGSHQVTVGARVDRVVLRQTISRVHIQFTDANNALLRQITFQNGSENHLNTLESSAYLQDRWSPAEGLVIETGARWDHDSFTGRNMFSPRIAGTYMLHASTETKLSAGIGVYYDRTNLSLISLSQQGSLTDVFFAPVPATISTTFLVDPSRLVMPRFINWSVSLETRLPARIYGRVEVLSRHGIHGWAYDALPNGNFLLGTNRQDRYDAIQFTARRELKPGYPWLISYTRSNARSNQTIDFTLNNFVTGAQTGGPLLWDSPNQLTSWGSMPLFWKLKKFDIAYSTIWRTGFPFIVINQFGQLVSGPGQFRFPDYFTLNVAVERKFTFHHYRWAARLGVDNVTNRENPTVVNNVIDSGDFLHFFGTGHRTLNGRIRFLGKATK
jgi:hypothetical protein